MQNSIEEKINILLAEAENKHKIDFFDYGKSEVQKIFWIDTYNESCLIYLLNIEIEYIKKYLGNPNESYLKRFESQNTIFSGYQIGMLEKSKMFSKSHFLNNYKTINNNKYFILSDFISKINYSCKNNRIINAKYNEMQELHEEILQTSANYALEKAINSIKKMPKAPLNNSQRAIVRTLLILLAMICFIGGIILGIGKSMWRFFIIGTVFALILGFVSEGFAYDEDLLYDRKQYRPRICD